MKSTFKPALLLMAGRMVAFATTFFIPIVLVRVFDQTIFGTYKQVFLIFATLFNLLQFGMAESLYYFLPLTPQKAGHYAANSLIILATAGIAGLGLLCWYSSEVAGLLGNPRLTAYIPYVGIYLLLSVASAVLEIVMTARKRFMATALAYAVSEMLRGAAFIIPALLFGELRWLLFGAILFAALRLAATLVYLFREFKGEIFPEITTLKDQLSYALPLAGSSLLADWSGQFHQYAVSHYFDAATFAVYAVGCLNIPLVELVHSPVSNVMMVRMAEELRDGQSNAVLGVWNDTTRKLALVFFPMLGLILVTAHELIVFLFTESYVGSIPIFMIWSTTVLLPVLQTDSVLRVYAETGFLLFVYALKLALTVALIYWFISFFNVWGAAMVTVLASFLAKILSLARFKRLAHIGLANLLPWKDLTLNLIVTVAAGTATMLLKSHLETPVLLTLVLSGMSFGIIYVALGFIFGLVTAEERQVLWRSLQRFPTRMTKVGHQIKEL
jgi:O-antigen/teichoic acid export membrane protein